MKRLVLVWAVAGVGLSVLSACGLGQDAQSAQQAVGAIDPAADTQAKANLQAALIAARTAYMTDGSYAGVTPAALQQVEPSLTYVTGASNGPNVISVSNNGSGWSAAVLSTSGLCLYAVVTSSGGTLMGSGRTSCSAGSAAQYATQSG